MLLIRYVCYELLFVVTVQYGEDGDLGVSYRSKKARKKKQKGSIFDVCSYN